MSVTNIKRRVAVFYDDKGEQIGRKGFSKTAKLVYFQDKAFNVFHEASSTLYKRWYWDINQYHYNINNPNPLILNKRSEPILDSEVYNVQLKTKVIRDLNDLAKGNLTLSPKVIIIGLIVIVAIYMIVTKQIKIGG